MREFLQYTGTGCAGILLAFAICAAILASTKIPGPPDQQAGFAMGILFCVFPMASIVFVTIGILLLRHWKKQV